MDNKSSIVEKLKSMKPTEVAMVCGFIKGMQYEVSEDTEKIQNSDGIDVEENKEISKK